MSAVVCGKRLLDELYGSLSITKRRRFSSSATSFAWPFESGSSVFPCLQDPFSHLRSLFPHMDPQVVERVLESCENDLDSAIKSLHDLCLNNQDEIPSVPVVENCPSASEDLQAIQDISLQLPAWVELLVTEMTKAKDLDDARSRASKALEAFEKSVIMQSSTVVPALQREVIALKGQLQELVRDNQILKKAVTIQHVRQGEHEQQSKELQHLKQLLTQYQEQVRTLEFNNYALSLHLQKAKDGSSIPGRFHPDVF